MHFNLALTHYGIQSGNAAQKHLVLSNQHLNHPNVGRCEQFMFINLERTMYVSV